MIKNVWIDADSCPLKVRNHVVNYCSTRGINVFFVANKEIECQCDNSKAPYQMIITDNEKDSADNYIFEQTTGGTLTNPSPDLVITRDIVFADRLVQKGVHVINDRGTEFTKEMRELRYERSLLEDVKEKSKTFEERIKMIDKEHSKEVRYK